jgi:carbonic anhydrase
LIFDQGLGDIFSIRIAGNIVNEDILGSMEFACKVAGSKLVVVLGHSKCGAVKGAFDHVEVGNLTALLSKIRPAVEEATSITGKSTSSNPDFLEKVAAINVSRTVNAIKERSAILKEMIDKCQIGLVGGMYSVENGKVEFYKEVIQKELQII